MKVARSIQAKRGAGACRRTQAYTIAEVVVAVLLLGIMVVSLFAGFSSGFAIVQLARENLRATQIMVQKMEAVRLYNWAEITNSSYLKPSFTDWYNPSGTNTHSEGAHYQGVVSLAAPAGIPSAYQNAMRGVTVTLYWTNYPHGETDKIVRTRQMETYVAHYGMQNYIYQ